MQKHAFSTQLGNEQQFWTPSTQICNLKAIRAQQQGNQFSSLEKSSQTATTAQTSQAIAGYRYAASMPSSPPLKAWARLETTAGSSCLLFCCTLWHLWKLLTHFCFPKASSPPSSSSLTPWKLPPHPLQHKDKVQGPVGRRVGRQGDLLHLAVLAAVTPPLREKGMGLFGGFRSDLCHTPGCHWSKQTGQRQNTPTEGI